MNAYVNQEMASAMAAAATWQRYEAAANADLASLVEGLASYVECVCACVLVA